jgi:EAL domain-containing protein (putative c-di-GMP-specific phosphodiesterase class I)
VAVFNEDMHRAVDRRRHLQRDLGNAVSAGAVAVRFQPVIGLAHRDMVAVESVPHWPQQSANEVAPSDLFAVAEQSGLAGIIAELMLNESLACGRILPSAIRIGLDLAPSLLLDRAKMASFIDIIAKSGVKPERLEFEITEAVLIDGGEKCLDHLRQLRSFGCRTAIDHFGLGATSLARLHEVPFNRLKIHGDFTARAEADPRSVSMLRAMIDMAHALGLVVTADGVVNEAQISLLSELGCDEAQGPFFAQPMPLAEILTFPALKIARLVPRTQHSG